MLLEDTEVSSQENSQALHMRPLDPQKVDMIIIVCPIAETMQETPR